MNVNVNLAQSIAFGRHVLTFAMGGVTVAAALHVINANDAANASQAISDIGTGLAKVIAGLTTLIGLVSAFYAAWSASPFSQLLAVSENPSVEKVVVTTSALANAVPSDKVTTQ
jgi:tetrahydromethanopterin S-methyltransferase subunit D